MVADVKETLSRIFSSNLNISQLINNSEFGQFLLNVHNSNKFKVEVKEEMDCVQFIRSIDQDSDEEQDSEFECNICRKTLATEISLALHSKLHESDEYPCDHCQETCTYSNELEKHICKKHRRSNHIHCCNVCKKKFSKKSNLVRHQNKFHE